MSLPSTDMIPTQEVVEGRRYRIKWPSEDCAYYIVITDYHDPHLGRLRPYELFIQTKSERHSEWVKAFTLLVTAIFRRERDPSFIIEQLRAVFSAQGGAWVRTPWMERPVLATSLVAAIGLRIEEHFRLRGYIASDEVILPAASEPAPDADALMPATDVLDVCDRCGARAVIYSEGCATCRACGRSDCS